MKKFGLLPGIAVLLLAVSCDTSTAPVNYRIDPRTIAVDIPAVIFNPYNKTDANQKRGLGINTLTVTVTSDQGEFQKNLNKTALPAGDLSNGYYRLSFPAVEGVLTGISLEAQGTTETFTFNSFERGWGDLVKFRAVIYPDSEAVENSSVALEPGLKGGASLRLLLDNALTAVTGYTGLLTDRVQAYSDLLPGDPDVPPPAPALDPGEIAIQPLWLENPTGLVYDIYTLVIDEDISRIDTMYNPLAAYYKDPWTDSWSYDEVTKTGKSIGGYVYVLEQGETDCPALDPMGDGFDSYKLQIDPYEAGQFLLVALIVRVAGEELAVTSQVKVIEIQ
jgi:hypothetical protein